MTQVKLSRRRRFSFISLVSLTQRRRSAPVSSRDPVDIAERVTVSLNVGIGVQEIGDCLTHNVKNVGLEFDFMSLKLETPNGS